MWTRNSQLMMSPQRLFPKCKQRPCHQPSSGRNTAVGIGGKRHHLRFSRNKRKLPSSPLSTRAHDTVLAEAG